MEISLLIPFAHLTWSDLLKCLKSASNSFLVMRLNCALKLSNWERWRIWKICFPAWWQLGYLKMWCRRLKKDQKYILLLINQIWTILLCDHLSYLPWIARQKFPQDTVHASPKKLTFLPLRNLSKWEWEGVISSELEEFDQAILYGFRRIKGMVWKITPFLLIQFPMVFFSSCFYFLQTVNGIFQH